MKEFFAQVEKVSREIRSVSDYIYSHPETALEELEASDKQCRLLKSWGYQVEKGFGGLKTAFRAVKKYGSGSGPRFAFLAEYDALPEIGHACGHNLISASALAAFYAADKVLSEQNADAELILIGTPAEEGRGGKVTMQKNGAFDDVDACLISHPYDITSMDDGALSITHYKVAFHGQASHAAIAPEKGINALDAMIQMFTAIALWRQQLPETTRVHGIITNGGSAANVIPDLTEAVCYVRAPDTQTQLQMEQRFREIVEGAALSTGTMMELTADCGYKAIRFNRPLNEEYAKCWQELGEQTRVANGTEGRGSTDFGDVSQLMPGANLHFGICPQPGTPLHCIEFREAAGTDYAFGQAMKVGAIMAKIGVRYCTDGSFRKSVDEDFRSRK